MSLPNRLTFLILSTNYFETELVGVSVCNPNTSTKKLNGFSSFKQTLNGTSMNSPGLNTPSEKLPVLGTVKVAPTPAGPPSAFCSRLPFVNVTTFTSNFDRDGLLLLESLASKLNFARKAAGQP